MLVTNSGKTDLAKLSNWAPSSALEIVKMFEPTELHTEMVWWNDTVFTRGKWMQWHWERQSLGESWETRAVIVHNYKLKENPDIAQWDFPLTEIDILEIKLDYC